MTCDIPAGYQVTEPPALSATHRLAARHDSIVIARPVVQLQVALDRAELKDLLPVTRGLPGVVGVKDLTPGAFGAPGTRRLVCLSDNSVALEQVLERVDNERFRYQVWGYTSPAARAVHYAVGEFRYADLGDGRTRVDWTYSFRLDPGRPPGSLGAVGRWLFRLAFLDRAYAELMRASLEKMKVYAEGTGGP